MSGTTREMQSPADVERPADASRAAESQLTAWAAAVGNRQVARRVAFAPQRPVLARFGAGEHSQLGSADTVDVNGVQLTEGQLIAMADLVGSYEDLKKIPADDLRKMQKVIQDDQDFRLDHTKGAFGDVGKLNEVTGGRFQKLSLDNDEHFAEGEGDGGRNHKTSWERITSARFRRPRRPPAATRRSPTRRAGSTRSRTTSSPTRSRRGTSSARRT